MPNQLVFIIVSFFVGYLTASFFKIDTLSQWMNSKVQAAYHESKPEPIKTAPKEAQVPPKPKFEFYTLLATEKRPLAASTNTTSIASTAAPVVPPPTVKEEQLAAKVPSGPTNVTLDKIAEKKAVLSPHKIQPQGNFLVQVASFKAKKDADQMKALLSLKGYLVTVIPVSQPQGNWFRVMVGPYSNRTLAQKAQIALARNEHINGMVKVGANY